MKKFLRPILAAGLWLAVACWTANVHVPRVCPDQDMARSAFDLRCHP